MKLNFLKDICYFNICLYYFKHPKAFSQGIDNLIQVELLNLLELSLIALLLVSLVLPLTSSAEYAFAIDATFLPSPYCF
jgi:hypothetical protein